MTAVIRTRGLTKRYGRDPGIIGIADLDLEVHRGEIVGFLGPNGAGKTTTMRLLLDLIRPTSGDVEVLGRDPRQDAVDIHRQVGYLPGDLVLYGDLTAGEMFDWFAHLRGMDASARRRVSALAERFTLDLHRPIGNLSKGNRQKVGLVQAFMHDPRLLVLDEPTSGLDPLMQQEFNRLVREVREDGASVFLSSHVLDEVEHVADRVAIVRDGRLAVIEQVGELKAQAVRRLDIRFAEAVPQALFEDLPGVREARVEGEVGRFVVDGSVDRLVKAAAMFEVVSITSLETDLEEVFLRYYDDEGEETNGA